MCDHLAVRGVHIDGGYREYIAVPESDCYILPDQLSDVDAVMIEPTTIAIQSCTRAQLEQEDMLLLTARALWAAPSCALPVRCAATSLWPTSWTTSWLSQGRRRKYTINTQKEDFLEKVMEYTNGRGATVSIDAACVKDSLLNLLKATGNAGRVITMGFSTAPTEVNQFLITSKELDVRGSRLQNKMFGKAIEMINAGTWTWPAPSPHTYPLTQAQEAFNFLDTRDPSIRKIVLTFDF